MKQTVSLSEINLDDFEPVTDLKQEGDTVSKNDLEEPVQEETAILQSNNSFREDTYDIISKVAYLIGVPKSIFENEYQSPRIEIYNRLEQDKNARIIRNLCSLRTAIERNFKTINDKMRNDYSSFYSAIEGIASQNMDILSEDGINLKVSRKLTDCLIEVNHQISNRLNNCKSIFPTWLNWTYLQNMFIMPKGLNEEGTKEAAELYYANKQYYPYQVYINWHPREVGNILSSDRKFTEILYQENGDFFRDYSKVSNVGEGVRNNIYDFIDNSNQVVLVVDCENSDPFKLCSALMDLDIAYRSKIKKVLLFDDAHASSAWKSLESYLKIPVVRKEIERIKKNKSLVDISMAVGVCQEHYVNQVDSFILASSDSDYWGLISALENAHFLVMVERDQCGPDLKQALREAEIYYCYIDDFYSGDGGEMKKGELFKEISHYIHQMVNVNIYEMMEEVLKTTRISMEEAEKSQFTAKYLKPMQLSIKGNGDVLLEINKR